MYTPQARRRLSVGLGLVLSSWLAVAAISCASFEANAYHTIGTVADAVDVSMRTWGDIVRAGKASDAQQAAVKAAYQKYQTAVAVAGEAIQAYRASKGDQKAAQLALDNLVTVAQQVQAVVAAFRS